jgi:hypothetical protein
MSEDNRFSLDSDDQLIMAALALLLARLPQSELLDELMYELTKRTK